MSGCGEDFIKAKTPRAAQTNHLDMEPRTLWMPYRIDKSGHQVNPIRLPEIDFLLAKLTGFVDTGSRSYGIIRRRGIPTGCRQFMAGPRVTDAYEPRQIRKEAAISNAVCVMGFSVQ